MIAKIRFYLSLVEELKVGNFSAYNNNNNSCFKTYMIKAIILFSLFQIIRVDIKSIAIEGNMPTCAFDRLSLYDGVTNTAPRLAQLCDILISDVIVYSYVTTHNVINIVFESDIVVGRPGFTLEYHSVLAMPTQVLGELYVSI